MAKIYRSKKWLAAVGQIQQCVLCGAWGTQVAHRNEGKGMGLKVDDCATAAICICCHDSIDNGNKLTREERRLRLCRWAGSVVTDYRILRNKVNILSAGAAQ